MVSYTFIKNKYFCLFFCVCFSRLSRQTLPEHFLLEKSGPLSLVTFALPYQETGFKEKKKLKRFLVFSPSILVASFCIHHLKNSFRHSHMLNPQEVPDVSR